MKSTQSVQKKIGNLGIAVSALSLFVSASLAAPVFAASGGSDRGGGDQCKNEIDKDRLAIQGWITRDEAKGLDFSLARVPGWTYDDPTPAKSYKKSMLSYLEEGKVVVTCYLDPARISDPAAKKIAEAEGVSYKAITIGNPPKPTTCVNYEDDSGVSHIDCNYDLVMASVGDPDYVTTHHEYASIAGVEMRTNTYISDFSISNQLSQFEHWQQVKLLGPKLADGKSGAGSSSSIDYGRSQAPCKKFSGTFGIGSGLKNYNDVFLKDSAGKQYLIEDSKLGVNAVWIAASELTERFADEGAGALITIDAKDIGPTPAGFSGTASDAPDGTEQLDLNCTAN